MTTEQNEVLVLRVIDDVCNGHDFADFEELVAEDQFERMAVPEYQHGVAGERYAVEWEFSVFPDRRFDLEDAVSDGDRAAVPGTCSGIHEGELWGIPPTGKRFAVQHPHWFRVSDGRVAEHWMLRDDLGMLRRFDIRPTLVRPE